MLEIVIPLAVGGCIGVGAFGEHLGHNKGKKETEEKLMSLLSTLEGLLQDRKVKKALALIERYTSGEESIHDLIPLIGLQVE